MTNVTTTDGDLYLTTINRLVNIKNSTNDPTSLKHIEDMIVALITDLTVKGMETTAPIVLAPAVSINETPTLASIAPTVSTLEQVATPTLDS